MEVDTNDLSKSVLSESATPLEVIGAIADRLQRCSDIDLIAEEAVACMVRYSHSPLVAFFALDEPRENLQLLAAYGFLPETLQAGASLPVAGSLTGMCVLRKDVIISENIDCDPRLEAATKQALLAQDLHTVVAIPLLYQDQVFGSVTLVYSNYLEFDQQESDTLFSIGKTIGLAIANVLHVQRLQSEVAERQQTLAALGKSEQRYRSVVEDQTEFIVRWLPDGTRTFVNESYCRYFGQPRAELIGSSVFHSIDPQDRQVVLEKIGRLRPDTPVGTDERRIIAPNGEQRWHRWTDRGLFDMQGQLVELQSVGRDITERKRVEDELRRSEEKFSKAFHASPDAIMISGLVDGKIIEVNEGFERSTGYRAAEALGRSADELGLWQQAEQSAAIARILQAQSVVRDLELDIHTKFGEVRTCVVSADTIQIGKSPYVITVARDITERKQHLAALEYQATHDSLTGLPNRDLLHRKVNQALNAAATRGEGAALLLMDLNRFKEINDTLGHHTGDTLLKQIGPRVSSVTSEKIHIFSRLGGDEFAMLLTSVGDVSEIEALVGRLVDSIRQPIDVGGLRIEISASVGISMFPEHGPDSSTLLRCADVAMYRAKNSVRGYEFYEPKLDLHTPKRLALMTELGLAIREDQLLLHYQPKIEISSQRVLGFEALVRWDHPTHGLIPPDQFVPLAEMSELIRPLTNWVLRSALAQWRCWRDEGITTRMSINLSARNLMDEDCVSTIQRLLHRYEVEPHLVDLEITESALIAEPERAQRILDRIHAMGVRFSIDDFGSGYSSLAYLKRIPIDTLKIDRSFVADMLENDQDALIVKSTVHLAHNLGLTVIAEGVEDPHTLQILQGMGCDQAQGYFIARPMPAQRGMEFLKKGPWKI